MPKLQSANSIKIYRIYSSIFLGITFGLALYSYWLVDILPPTSKRIILSTLFVCLVGTVAYFILIEVWIAPIVAELTLGRRWAIAIQSILVAVFLVFAGTSAWRAPRFLTFLLPERTVQITTTDSNSLDSAVSILWFRTSLGDVSFDTFEQQGWKRMGDKFVLSDFQDNSFSWTGTPGEIVLITFRTSPQSKSIKITWDGESEVVNLFSEREGMYYYRHTFKVPFYASHYVVLILVILNFVVIAFAAHLLYIKKRDEILAFFRQPAITYQKKQTEFTIIFLLCLLALSLRIFNLDNLYPYADEYPYLLSTKQLLSGIPLHDLYQRGIYIVTLPVAASLATFGATLWAARLPGVIFNTLAIIPLYLVSKRINWQTAVISCVLFATSPYIISFSRDIREYAYYPFYFYWIILIMIIFLEKIPNPFNFREFWHKSWHTIIGLSLILVLPIIYALVIDLTSTSKLILLAYFVFFIFLLERLDLGYRTNLVIAVSIGLGTLVILLKNILVLADYTKLDINSQPLQYFFSNPQQQWYFNRLSIFILWGILYGFFISLSSRKFNFVPAFLSALYFFFIVFFMTFFTVTQFGIHPRFLSSAQLWYIPIVAIGLSTVSLILYTWFQNNRKIIWYLSLIIITVTSFNISQILFPTFFKGEYMPITDFVHDRFEVTHPFMLEKVEEDDVLISSVYASYVEWQENPPFAAIYPFTITYFNSQNANPREYVYSIVSNNKKGWIVIDKVRYKLAKEPIPFKTINIDNKTLMFIGEFDSQYIWHWK